MIFANTAELLDRIEEVAGRRLKAPPQIFEDATSYMNIAGGTVLRLEGDDYFVITDAREGRFGIDDQPKFWVKYVFDLTTGERKIIKLVFHEEFSVQLGLVRIRCRRNPDKEAEILDLVRGHPRFMQGRTVKDPADNTIRILDIVPGRSLYKHIIDMEMSHEEYFHDLFPELMREVVGVIEALAELHQKGQHHGDVRNDHILINRKTGLFTWIDFDYEVNYTDYDLWSLGNVLNVVVGMGRHTLHDIRTWPQDYPHLKGALAEEDMVLLFKNRVANLGKLYPYIPCQLNDILLRFSVGSPDFYTDLQSLIADLRESIDYEPQEVIVGIPSA